MQGALLPGRVVQQQQARQQPQATLPPDHSHLHCHPQSRPRPGSSAWPASRRLPHTQHRPAAERSDNSTSPPPLEPSAIVERRPEEGRRGEAAGPGPGTAAPLELRPGAGLQGGGEERSALQRFLNPSREELPNDVAMDVWDHFDELRERVIVGGLAVLIAVLTCFAFSKDLVVFLEAPVASQGVRFLQLSPGEFFFTTLKVAGYAGILLATPTVLYEATAYVVPALTLNERRLLAPIVFGSSILFYLGLLFSYEVLTPAALGFFVSYADGAVESLWSIDQYFEFVLILMLSTGLSFQVPVIQILLGQTGIVSSAQMFAQWRWVVVGATVAAAVLTPSTDPFTQTLLALPLIGLYLGGAGFVRLLEKRKVQEAAA